MEKLYVNFVRSVDNVQTRDVEIEFGFEEIGYSTLRAIQEQKDDAMYVE